MFSGTSDKLEPAYKDAWQAWQLKPTPQTTGALLKHVTPVIDTALRSYAGTSAASPTLRGRARQMALKSFQTYDPNRGSLKTHVLSQLQGLRRATAQEHQIVRVPEQVGLDYQYLTDSETELRDNLGRDPSDLEIADHTGLSLKRLKHIRQFSVPTAEGTMLRPGVGGGDVSDPQVRLPHREQANAEAWQELIYHDLVPTDQTIMDYLLGRNGTPRLSTNDIAKRLGVSAGAVSQRAARIQSLLDKRFDYDHL